MLKALILCQAVHAQKELLKLNKDIDFNPNTFGYADDLISVIKLDLTKEDPIEQISNILNIYDNFSKISGLSNNSSKTVYGFITEKNNKEIRKITDLLSEKWGADKENFKFNGD